MSDKLPSYYSISDEVSHALHHGSPLVALESAVITHGLPAPLNLELALEMETIIRDHGAIPATIAVVDGKLCIGLNNEILKRLAEHEQAVKLSTRNMAVAISQQLTGGTTVAATLLAAKAVGLHVFATGGIGGVHRGNPFDVSADLDELAHSPVIVVCAGAKAILDIPATLEALETRGVPVLGYQTDTFPAFYSVSSSLPLDSRVETPRDVAGIARVHWSLGNKQAVLVCQPPPLEAAIDNNIIEQAVQLALREAAQQNITGSAVTPYLLSRVKMATENKSLTTNLALLKNNARLAAQIAQAWYGSSQRNF